MRTDESLPRPTQLVSGGTRIQSQDSLTAQPQLYTCAALPVSCEECLDECRTASQLWGWEEWWWLPHPHFFLSSQVLFTVCVFPLWHLLWTVTYISHELCSSPRTPRLGVGLNPAFKEWVRLGWAFGCVFFLQLPCVLFLTVCTFSAPNWSWNSMYLVEHKDLSLCLGITAWSSHWWVVHSLLTTPSAFSPPPCPPPPSPPAYLWGV